MGQTRPVEDGQAEPGKEAGVFVSDGRGQAYGTYVHGIFDKGDMAFALVKALAQRKGIALGHDGIEDYAQFKEWQYDKLADTLRQYMDMEEIYGILGEACVE